MRIFYVIFQRKNKKAPWFSAPLATRAIAELYRQHACKVEHESTSQACMPGVKTGMSNVANHFCPHIGTLSRQYQRPCRRCIGSITLWEPVLRGTPLGMAQSVSKSKVCLIESQIRGVKKGRDQFLVSILQSCQSYKGVY